LYIKVLFKLGSVLPPATYKLVGISDVSIKVADGPNNGLGNEGSFDRLSCFRSGATTDIEEHVSSQTPLNSPPITNIVYYYLEYTQAV
jgi:hypothetical protein